MIKVILLIGMWSPILYTPCTESSAGDDGFWWHLLSKWTAVPRGSSSAGWRALDSPQSACHEDTPFTRALQTARPPSPPDAIPLQKTFLTLRRALTSVLSVRSDSRWVLRWTAALSRGGSAGAELLAQQSVSWDCNSSRRPCENRGLLVSDAKPNKGHGSNICLQNRDRWVRAACYVNLFSGWIPPERFLWQLIHQVEREWTRSLKI